MLVDGHGLGSGLDAQECSREPPGCPRVLGGGLDAQCLQNGDVLRMVCGIILLVGEHGGGPALEEGGEGRMDREAESKDGI